MDDSFNSECSDIPTEPSQEKLLRRPTSFQKMVSGVKSLATGVASITMASGYMVGGAKLAQAITNTVYAYLPLNYNTEDEAAVGYWTLVAVCPVILYTGVQSARVLYRNLERARLDLERFEDDLDSEIRDEQKIKNHVTAAVKSASASSNIPVLCLEILLPLLDQQTLDYRIAVGIMAVSFATNYYCQLKVNENTIQLFQDRMRDNINRNLPTDSSYCEDFDAERTAVLDTAIPTSIVTHLVKHYVSIEPRGHFYGFASELAIIGGMSLCLASQDKRNFVEAKHRGEGVLVDLGLGLDGNEEVCKVNKKINRINATAHLRSAAMGGSFADIMVRSVQLFSDTQTIKIPASLLGILIYLMSIDVSKKYSARGYAINEEMTQASGMQPAAPSAPLLPRNNHSSLIRDLSSPLPQDLSGLDGQVPSSASVVSRSSSIN